MRSTFSSLRLSSARSTVSPPWWRSWSRVMRHEIRVEGEAFALRPVDFPDAAFITELRSESDHTRYINPTPPGVAEQKQYLRQYFSRPGDYYFVVERISDRSREGLVAVYDV